VSLHRRLRPQYRYASSHPAPAKAKGGDGTFSNITTDQYETISNVTTDKAGVWFSIVDGRKNGEESTLPPRRAFREHLALRDLCRCPQCVDQSTQQRHYAFASIPANIQAHPRVADDGTIEVRWENDVVGFGPEHISRFEPALITTESDLIRRLHSRHLLYGYQKWTGAEMAGGRKKQLEFDYDRYISANEVRDQAVVELVRWGLIFVRNVPFETDAVKRILKRIGPLRNTFYGETWDVRSVPGAANVAYTARELGFHQDLLYMANPPGLQALHVMRASSTGGESLFSDGARAVDSMLRRSASHASALLTFPVTYRYKNAGEWYEYTRPTLEGGWRRWFGKSLDSDESRFRRGYGTHYDAINWSPPFQGPLTMNVGMTTTRASKLKSADVESARSRLQEYHQAAALLKERIEHPSSVYETRMESGTCVIFNNRRILHARKAFPVGGGSQGAEGAEGAAGAEGEERWLRGAYGDLDPLMSRFRMVRERRARTPSRSAGKWRWQPARTEAKAVAKGVEGSRDGREQDASEGMDQRVNRRPKWRKVP
jgi:gamma-butyrobetaine dioxygenase